MNFLFDLDDTLYPEKIFIYQGFLAVAKFLKEKGKLDLLSSYLELVALFEKGSNKIFDDFVELHKLLLDPIVLLNVYRNANKKLFLYPEVQSVLTGLKNSNNNLILITNGNFGTQKSKIKELKLESYFDSIFVLDDFGKEFWKPSTLILEKIYNMYGSNRDNYVFIGNGQEDYDFATKAKIKFVFIDRNGVLRKAIMRERGKVIVIESLKEITFLFKEDK